MDGSCGVDQQIEYSTKSFKHQSGHYSGSWKIPVEARGLVHGVTELLTDCDE